MICTGFQNQAASEKQITKPNFITIHIGDCDPGYDSEAFKELSAVLGKEQLHILSRTQHKFNSAERILSVKALDLVMFPSWLEHSVSKNKKATEDRISISFNTFVRGIIGNKGGSSELVLK